MTEPQASAKKPASVFAICLAIFFLPAFAPSAQFLARDTARIHAPIKEYLAQRLSQGVFPQWNPYDVLGFPLLPTATDSLLHPFSLLLVALPFSVALKAWVLLTFFGAALGAWAWARRLGCGPLSSLAAGLGFALCGHLVSDCDKLNFLTAFAALPFVLACAHAFLEHGGPARLAAFAAASFVCAAAGDLQAWGLCVAFVAVYGFLFVEGVSRRALALRALSCVCVAAAVATPVVLPVLAFLPESSRAVPLGVEAARWNLSPLRLVELGVPYLFRSPAESTRAAAYLAFGGGDELAVIPWARSIYLGATTLALATIGFFSSKHARRLGVAALVFAWIALGPNAGFLQLARHLPVLGAFRYWEKVAIWPSLLLVLAAAIGFERVRAGALAARPARRVVFVGGALLVAALVLSIARPGADASAGARELFLNLRDGALHAGGFATVLGLLLSVPRLQGIALRAPALLLAMVALDVATANFGAYDLAGRAVVQPSSPLGEALAAQSEPARVLALDADATRRWPELLPSEASNRLGALTLQPYWNLLYKVGSFEPYRALIPARLHDVVGRVRDFATLGLWNVQDVVVPFDLKLLEGHLVAPYVPSRTDPSTPAYLVALPHRPRVYLADELGEADRPGALGFVLTTSPLSPRSVVEGTRVPADYRPPHGSAQIVRDESERVEISASADGPALVILNDQLAPGWIATIDGSETPIYAANYLVRGVWIPAGGHTIVFRYRTPGFFPGLVIFALAALALAGWWLAARRRI